MLVGVMLGLAALGSGCSSNDDGTPAPGRVNISGTVRDGFTGTGIAGAAVTVDGLSGVSTFSSATGTYTVLSVPANASYRLVGAHADYRATRNDSIVVGSASVTSDVTALAEADVQRQYAALGRTPVAGTAIVIVDLREMGGAPRAGILVSDMTLYDSAFNPVGLGPYVFGSGGDVVDYTTLSESTIFGGRSRVAFLDVPAGTFTLQLTVPYSTPDAPAEPGGASPAALKTLVTAVITAAGGATLVRR